MSSTLRRIDNEPHPGDFEKGHLAEMLKKRQAQNANLLAILKGETIALQRYQNTYVPGTSVLPWMDEERLMQEFTATVDERFKGIETNEIAVRTNIRISKGLEYPTNKLLPGQKERLIEQYEGILAKAGEMAKRNEDLFRDQWVAQCIGFVCGNRNLFGQDVFLTK